MIGVALLVSLLSPGMVASEDEGSLAKLRRSLETPAHRTLMELIAHPNTEIAPFSTDGCSGGLSSTWSVVADLFPDFSAAHEGRPPWEACCVAHDRRYYDADKATDASQSYNARLAADEELRSCVLEAGDARILELAHHYSVTDDKVRLAYGAIADAMFNSVRFGGAPCSGFSWRWGYGFPDCFNTTGVDP
jgi:hypothetical protein